MAQTLRGTNVLWDGTAATGVNGKSAFAYLGALSQATVFIWNKDGANPTNITIEVGEGQGTPGRNNNPTNWFVLGDLTGAAYTVVVAANIKKAINLSDLGATYLRLSSSANIIVYASCETAD